MIRTLRLRMMIAVSVLAIAAVILVALAARQRTRAEFRRFQELEKSATSESQENAVTAKIADLLAKGCCDSQTLNTAATQLSTNDVLVLVDSANNVIAKAGKPLERVADFQFHRQGDEILVGAISKGSGHEVPVTLQFHLAGTPVRTSAGSVVDSYVFPIPTEVDGQQPGSLFLGNVDRSLLLATALVAAIVLLATWILTRRIAGPVEALRKAARELAGGDLAQRVEISGSDEIAELSHSFNAMSSELERQQKLRRNLVHDVVHELRTPLTALRCHLDSICDDVSTNPRAEIEKASEEIDHLTRLVEDLHEVALAEARELRLTRSNELLAPIVISAARAAGLQRDPRLQMEVGEDITIYGDAERLRQVLLNLLSNAARHTPPDGTVTIRSMFANEETIVEVHNTGSCLTEEELARVFDRFYRADPARVRSSGGTGLGLAIVKNLIEAQGGRVWAQTSSSGVVFAFGLAEVKKDSSIALAKSSDSLRTPLGL